MRRISLERWICLAAFGAGCSGSGGGDAETGGGGRAANAGAIGTAGAIGASTGGNVSVGGGGTPGIGGAPDGNGSGGAGAIGVTGGDAGRGVDGSSAGRAGAGGSSAAAGTGGGAGAGGVAVSRCSAATPAAGTYFVDATAGSDTKDGATPATAWQTLAKVNATTFQPGNALCFKAGGAWTGSLAPKGSGSATAPILVGQFGTGAKPRIAAGTSDLQALLLQNVQYWEVNDLELTNMKSAPGD